MRFLEESKQLISKKTFFKCCHWKKPACLLAPAPAERVPQEAKTNVDTAPTYLVSPEQSIGFPQYLEVGGQVTGW